MTGLPGAAATFMAVSLRAGDVMVQRGTNHAWVNRGSEPARLPIVLLDAKPLGIGHPRQRGEQAR